MTLGSTARSVPVVLCGALGQTPDRGRLGARVRCRDGDDRQPGGHRDRLGQPGRRAAADADQGVDLVAGRRLPGPLGHLDRDVHDHLVVAERDRDVGGDLVGQVHRVLGGDQHDPARAEAGYLVAEAAGRLAGAEADALGQGVVNEA